MKLTTRHLGLLLLLCLGAATAFVVAASPATIRGPLYGVRLGDGTWDDSVVVPGHIFTCYPSHDAEVIADCQAIVAGQLLHTTVFESRTFFQTSKPCTVTFAGNSLTCSAATYSANLGIALPLVWVKEDAGLNASQLNELRLQSWLINQPESFWTPIIFLTPGIVTVALLLLGWHALRTGPVLVRSTALALAAGGAYFVTLCATVFALLILHYVD